MQWLKRRPANDRDRKVFGRHFVSLLVERARAGASVEPWRWTFATNKYKVPELADATARSQFAALGSFAEQIVAAWDALGTLKKLAADREQRRAAERKARDHRCDELVEKRRRAGELYAGVPGDILALAQTDRAKAVAEYARRYGLSLEQARRVIDANVR